MFVFGWFLVPVSCLSLFFLGTFQLNFIKILDLKVLWFNIMHARSRFCGVSLLFLLCVSELRRIKSSEAF